MSRRYGPHDPAAAQIVTVLGRGRYPKEEERPLPAALVKQRRTINEIAHQNGEKSEGTR